MSSWNDTINFYKELSESRKDWVVLQDYIQKVSALLIGVKKTYEGEIEPYTSLFSLGFRSLERKQTLLILRIDQEMFAEIINRSEIEMTNLKIQLMNAEDPVNLLLIISELVEEHLL